MHLLDSKKMSREKRCRAKNWVFTLNNYTPEMENRLKELECEWMVYGHEEAPETGTKHLQGAICFKGRRDKNALNKLFPWFLEVMQGSPQDSKTYCTKEDTTGYFEKGIMPLSKSKQTKTDWEEVYELAKEGKFDEIRKDIYIRYQKSLKQLYFDNRHDTDMKEVDEFNIKKHFLWLWGPTGTGKSHTARRIAKELGCDEPYLKGLNKWWDGYDYQKVTIIEEADPKSCEYLGSKFKQWCDKWSFYAEIKGNTIPNCRPEYIIITSNYAMSDCFTNPDDYVPMKRRLTEVKLESRDFHLYWPKSQAELELEKQTEEGAGAPSSPGNMIPGPNEESLVSGSIQSSQPEMEEEVEDLPSEPDEPMKKKRKCIED